MSDTSKKFRGIVPLARIGCHRRQRHRPPPHRSRPATNARSPLAPTPRPPHGRALPGKRAMRSWINRWLLVALLCLAPLVAIASEEPRADLVRLLTAEQPAAVSALDALVARGGDDMIAGLILARRYRRDLEEALDAALAELTGADADSWFDWMLWLQLHDGLVAHPADLHGPTPRPAIARSAFPRVPARGRGARHPPRGDRLGRCPGRRHPGTRPAGLHCGRRSELSSTRGQGLRRRHQWRCTCLSIAHSQLARNVQRHDWRRGSQPGLLHPLRIGHPLRSQAWRDVATPLIFGSSGFLYRSNKLMYDTLYQVPCGTSSPAGRSWAR